MSLDKTCAFTGHRPKSFAFGADESDERCVAIKARLAEEIEKLLQKGVDTFISGMAEGVDTWAAEAVIALKEREPSVRLIAAVPFRGYEQGRRFRQERWQRILLQCSDIIYACEQSHRGAYHARDRRMVDEAAYLIAVYGGTSGGTAYTMEYAKKMGREIVIIEV